MDTAKPSTPSTNTAEKTSTLFGDPTADISFVSSDGVTFKIHSKYLGAVSEGFGAPESTVIDSKPIALAEPAEVLEVLFQFVHPPFEFHQSHQPSVKDMEIKLFFAVATAAEKYVVYGIMNIELYESHPVEVLNHAANHNYDDLAISQILQFQLGETRVEMPCAIVSKENGLIKSKLKSKPFPNLPK